MSTTQTIKKSFVPRGQLLNLSATAALGASVFMTQKFDSDSPNANFFPRLGVDSSNASNMKGLQFPPIDFSPLEEANVLECKMDSSDQLPTWGQRQLREQLLKNERLQSSGLPIGKKLLALSGKVKGLPSDFAANHDYYLHGLPKRLP